MKKYILSLNWNNASFIFILMSLGALANEDCINITYWCMLMILIGIPATLFVLFAGRKKDKN